MHEIHLQARRDLEREESEYRAQKHKEKIVVVQPDARVESRTVVIEELDTLVTMSAVLASCIDLLLAVGAPALRRTPGCAPVAWIDAHALACGEPDDGSEHRIGNCESNAKRGGAHWRVQAKEGCEKQCKGHPRDDLVHVERPLEAVCPPLLRHNGVWNSSGGHGCDAVFEPVRSSAWCTTPAVLQAGGGEVVGRSLTELVRADVTHEAEDRLALLSVASF